MRLEWAGQAGQAGLRVPVAARGAEPGANNDRNPGILQDYMGGGEAHKGVPWPWRCLPPP